MTTESRDRQSQVLSIISQLIEKSDHIGDAETFGSDERVGFQFEAGEFSGEIFMSKTTADTYWPDPEK